MGVTLAPGTAVTGFLHEGGRIRGVRTVDGVIESPVVVDAAGAWTRLLADEVGIRIPIIPTRHQLFITEPIPGIEPHHPIVRIHEPSVYTRPEQGGLMLGGYEDHPLQIDMRKEPDGFQIRDLTLDVGVLWGLAGEVAAHFPALRGARLHEHRGGLPTISPDGDHIVGPVGGLARLLHRLGLQRRGPVHLRLGGPRARRPHPRRIQPAGPGPNVRRALPGSGPRRGRAAGGLRPRVRAKVHEGPVTRA